MSFVDSEVPKIVVKLDVIPPEERLILVFLQIIDKNDVIPPEERSILVFFIRFSEIGSRAKMRQEFRS